MGSGFGAVGKEEEEVEGRKTDRERVPETNRKDKLALPISFPAFSRSLSPSLPFFSSAQTNLDDPARIALAELGHSSEVSGSGRSKERDERRRRKKKESISQKKKKVGKNLGSLHSSTSLALSSPHSSFLLLSRSSNTASAASAAPASPSALRALLSSSVPFSSSW